MVSELVGLGATLEPDTHGVELGVGAGAARRVAVGETLGGVDDEVPTGHAHLSGLVARDLGVGRGRRGRRLVDAAPGRRLVDHRETGVVEPTLGPVERQRERRGHRHGAAALGADRRTRRLRLVGRLDLQREAGRAGVLAVVGGDRDVVGAGGVSGRRACDLGGAVAVVGERESLDVEVGRERELVVIGVSGADRERTEGLLLHGGLTGDRRDHGCAVGHLVAVDREVAEGDQLLLGRLGVALGGEQASERLCVLTLDRGAVEPRLRHGERGP